MAEKKSALVDNIDALNEMLERVKKAQTEYEQFTQEQVDRIFKAAATAADKARIPLARMAVEDTGMGVLEDKIIKNHFASEYIYNKHKNAKTCGIISEDKENGIKTVADLIQRTEEDMLKVRNLGRKSLDEVLGKIKSYGLQLKEKDE